MAEKDKVEKLFFSHRDIFADVFNCCVFNGRQAVDSKKLVDSDTESQYSDHQNQHHTQFRDLVKGYQEGKRTLALFGIENQSKVDSLMPARVLNYNISSYAKQFSSGADKLYPVMTIVLYFGQKRWKASRQLEDLFDPENFPELKQYMPKMEIKVVEVAYLEEELDKMTSDFKHVASYLINRRKNKNYQPDDLELKHFEDFMNLISALDHEGVDQFQEWISDNGNDEVKSEMMNFIDRAKAEGEARGRSQERLEARREGLDNLILSFGESGLSDEMIFNQAKKRYGKYFTDEEIKQFMDEAKLGV